MGDGRREGESYFATIDQVMSVLKSVTCVNDSDTSLCCLELTEDYANLSRGTWEISLVSFLPEKLPDEVRIVNIYCESVLGLFKKKDAQYESLTSVLVAQVSVYPKSVFPKLVTMVRELWFRISEPNMKPKFFLTNAIDPERTPITMTGQLHILLRKIAS